MALLTQGALTIGFIAVTMWGSSVREGYQVLLKSSVITTLIPFGYMFLGLIRLDGEPAWKRAAGVVGLLVSVAGMIAAFVPGSDVTSVARYEVKLLVGSVLPLAVGLAFYVQSAAAGAALRLSRPRALTNPVQSRPNGLARTTSAPACAARDRPAAVLEAQHLQCARQRID